MGKCAKTPTNYGSFLASVSSNRATGYFLPVVCRGASVLRSSLIVLLYSKWRVIWLSSEDGSFVVLLCDCGMEVVSIVLMVAQTVKKVNRTGKDEVYHQVDIYGVGRRKNHVENSVSCCGLRHRKKTTETVIFLPWWAIEDSNLSPRQRQWRALAKWANRPNFLIITNRGESCNWE